MKILALIAQLYLGGYFLYNAVNHFRNVQMMAGFAKMRGVPAPQHLWVVVTGVMHLGAGLSLLFGYRVEAGAGLAIIFPAAGRLLCPSLLDRPGHGPRRPAGKLRQEPGARGGTAAYHAPPPDAWAIALGR